MKYRYFFSLCWFAGLSFLSSCATDEEPVMPEEVKQPIKLATRVDGAPFKEGATIGLYVSDNQQQPGLLNPQQNYVDNMQLVYANNAWNTDSEIHWKDNDSKLTFYAYHPFIKEATDALALPIELPSEMTASNRDKYDILWGKTEAEGIKETVNLDLKHLMSHVTVRVKPGNGLTEEEINEHVNYVEFPEMRYKATLNLMSGELNIVDTKRTIKFYKYPHNDDLKSYFLPQVCDSNQPLFLIFYRHHGYPYYGKQVFKAGKHYILTITLNRSGSGISVGTAGWQESDEDYGGVVS